MSNCIITFLMCNPGQTPYNGPCSRCVTPHGEGMYLVFQLGEHLGSLCGQCVVDVVSIFLETAQYADADDGRLIPKELLERAAAVLFRPTVVAHDDQVLDDQEADDHEAERQYLCSHTQACSPDRNYCQDVMF